MSSSRPQGRRIKVSSTSSKKLGRTSFSGSSILRHVLSRKQVVRAKAKAAANFRDQVEGTHQRLLPTRSYLIYAADMSSVEKQQLLDLQNLDSLDLGFDAADEDWMDDVLQGNVQMETSNARGELDEVVQDICGEGLKDRRWRDTGTRRDRTQQWVNQFETNMMTIVDAYLGWRAVRGERGWAELAVSDPPGEFQAGYPLTVMDVFGESIS